MGLGRRLDVPVGDLSMIRGLWEVRVRKYRQRQMKEKERVEQSALARIDQEWQYRIYCKTLKTEERNLLHRYLEKSKRTEVQPCTEWEQQDEDDPEQNRLIFRLDGDQWRDFPRELQWMTYLKEWHIRGTKISRLPEFLPLFSQLLVLQIPQNAIDELPPEIGKLTSLQELNVSYNRLSSVPPELGDCENLKRLELTGNLNLSELPFELSGLKQLVHLDIAENRFISIPICALRMSRLQLLDLSNNSLTDLPQDMDRLEQLVTLFIHKNSLSYLPHCLTKISTLKMIVVSGDELNCIPTSLCRNPNIKFIRLYDNRSAKKKKEEEEKKKGKNKRRRWNQPREEEVQKDSREKEFMEAYVNSLMDRDVVPESTTKVSISCLL
ncbi:leucine-rich repeat-containing protein 2 [Centropristis striata]|uniref:leucine-rich repeat-containing protein 2 n=1 Tax=Centropristis striata TaxID=184440 RepID=UPI0027DF0E3F|nr:leucine-rich repeat-containing protein 2 [Centropristis striata]XP_059193516.1 leucine-rich repeat-containing protein 2 [Centropristis striata]XP_059193517.1 leucine-rich repeat-containing protein 2 [Centropristis striata]